MKCPGCGTELGGGSEYCGTCGGRIEGSSIDYSRKKKKAVDIYEGNSFESPAEDSMDEQEMTSVILWSVRFVFLLFGLPIGGVIFLVKGFIENDSLYLILGQVLLALAIILAFVYFRYLREGDDSREALVEPDLPKYQRRL